MNRKRFTINFGSKLKRNVSYFVFIFFNIIVTIIPFFILYGFICFCFFNIEKTDHVFPLLAVIFILFVFIYLSVITYYSFRKEYIDLANNAVIIRTNWLDCCIFSKCLLVKEIVKCEKYNGGLVELIGRHGVYRHYHLSVFFNIYDAVDIFDDKGNVYRIAIKDSDTFVSQLNELIKSKNSADEKSQSE